MGARPPFLLRIDRSLIYFIIVCHTKQDTFLSYAMLVNVVAEWFGKLSCRTVLGMVAFIILSKNVNEYSHNYSCELGVDREHTCNASSDTVISCGVPNSNRPCGKSDATTMISAVRLAGSTGTPPVADVISRMYTCRNSGVLSSLVCVRQLMGRWKEIEIRCMYDHIVSLYLYLYMHANYWRI